MKCQEQVVFYSGGSRPSDGGRGGGGGAGGGLKNIFFRPEGETGWEGWEGVARPLPCIRHCLMYL